MDEQKDPLQVKIEAARAQLAPETKSAIDAVPWQASILKMRETKGYSFEQLGDLTTETELLLCGLISTKEYPIELERRMRLNKGQINELLTEMNQQVFSKIKEELIKNTSRKKALESSLLNAPAKPVSLEDSEKEILTSAGIEILNGKPAPQPTTLPIPEKLEITGKVLPRTTSPQVHPIFTQKMSSAVQTQTKTTEHGLVKPEKPLPSAYPKGEDPYRIKPE